MSLSIGNIFQTPSVYKSSPLNTVSGMAKSIWESSGWNNPSVNNFGTSSLASFNKTMFDTLGGIRTEASSFNKSLSSMSSMSQFSPNIGKAATSSDKDVLSASVASKASVSNFTKTNVEVSQLAKTQQNTGAALNAADNSFTGDKFSISIADSAGKSVSFSVDISETSNNKSIMNSMAEKINSAGAGYKATVVEDKEAGTVSLKLDGGKTGGKDGKFTVTDSSAANLSNIAQEAASAQYTVNGKGFTSETNTGVNLIDGVTADLKKVGNTSISYSPDSKKATDSVQSFLDDYNKLKDASSGSKILSGQFSQIERNFNRAFESMGIGKDSDGKLVIKNESKLAESVLNGSFSRNFQGVGSFGSKVRDVANKAYVTAYSEAMTQNFNKMMGTNTSTNDWSSMLLNASAYSGLLFNAFI
ncbi:MAG: flagellar filament capping protein FliD [Oscillospiraceae bacterium]|nr:flagellar filament capping protein FliD [Oscillospiraceae bacterium]